MSSPDREQRNIPMRKINCDKSTLERIKWKKIIEYFYIKKRVRYAFYLENQTDFRDSSEFHLLPIVFRPSTHYICAHSLSILVESGGALHCVLLQTIASQLYIPQPRLHPRKYLSPKRMNTSSDSTLQSQNCTEAIDLSTDSQEIRHLEQLRGQIEQLNRWPPQYGNLLSCNKLESQERATKYKAEAWMIFDGYFQIIRVFTVIQPFPGLGLRIYLKSYSSFSPSLVNPSIIIKMSDFNIVNVQSQSQVGKSVDTTKLLMLALDVRDFTDFLPVLKQLQITSNKILKELDPMLGKREKKTISLPYNLLRKFETLKDNLVQSEKVLEFQGRVYGCSVANRDYQKVHDQLFFRKTLKSYDEKRLWMKQYILNNEATVQRIQEEVKKNIDYQVHKFTEFRKELNIERLEHNYEEKLELMDKNIALLHRNIHARQKIKSKLSAVIQKRKSQKQAATQQIASKEEIIQNDISPPPFCAKFFKTPSFTPLLLYYFAKQTIRQEFLTHSISTLKKGSKTITYNNQQVKVALDKIQQRIELDNSEISITLQQLGEGVQSKEVRDLLKQHKVTKTDYFLYLREIQRHCHQILSIYGNYFQYALTNISFPNHKKSKSASKRYKIKPITQAAHNYQHKELIKDFQLYRQQHKVRIMKEKEERELQRKILAEANKLVLKELSKSVMKQLNQSVNDKENKIDIPIEEEEFTQI